MKLEVRNQIKEDRGIRLYSGDTFIAQTYVGNMPPTLAECNADIIVKCVNEWPTLLAQRDALLEAAQDAKAALEVLKYPKDDPFYERTEAKLRAALSMCEENPAPAGGEGSK